MDLVKNLNWRYATKNFDIIKKVSVKDLNSIKEAVRLSASSYGLQAYKVLIIQDEAIRKQLRAVAWDQPQITDSSHLFVFCNYNTVSEDMIDDYMKLVAEIKGIDVSLLDGFKGMLMGSISSKSVEDVKAWTSKQTYIALANLLVAAAELKIDACPMEGFDADKFNEILGLKEKGLSASVIGAIGYRSDEDQSQFSPKVRKSLATLYDEI